MFPAMHVSQYVERGGARIPGKRASYIRASLGDNPQYMYRRFVALYLYPYLFVFMRRCMALSILQVGLVPTTLDNFHFAAG